MGATSSHPVVYRLSFMTMTRPPRLFLYALPEAESLCPSTSLIGYHLCHGPQHAYSCDPFERQTTYRDEHHRRTIFDRQLILRAKLSHIEIQIQGLTNRLAINPPQPATPHQATFDPFEERT